MKNKNLLKRKHSNKKVFLMKVMLLKRMKKVRLVVKYPKYPFLNFNSQLNWNKRMFIYPMYFKLSIIKKEIKEDLESAIIETQQ